MQKFILGFLFFFFGQTLIAQEIEILPKVYPGDSCMCNDDSSYVLCTGLNKAALFKRENNSLLKWFYFDERIQASQFYRSEKLLLQTDSVGVLLDLEDWELLRSKNLGGTAATFGNKGKELIVARPARSFRKKTTRQILQEMSEPGSHLIILDKNLEIEDSIALKTIRPSRLLLNGNTIAIEAENPNLRNREKGTGMTIQAEIKTEIVNLKNGEKRIERRVMEKENKHYRSDIPANYYRTSLEEVHFQPEKGYLIQYGKGLPEGGVVKAWDLLNSRYIGTLGQGNSMNRLEGFFNEHIFIAHDWVDTDSVKTFQEYVYHDSIMRINDKRSIKARLAIDLEDLSFSMVKKTDVDSIKARPRQGIYMDAERSMTPRLRRGKWHLKFDPLSMNFELMDKKGLVLLHFYSFEKEEWAIVHPSGKWMGSKNCSDYLSLVAAGEAKGREELEKRRDSEFVSEYLRSILQ